MRHTTPAQRLATLRQRADKRPGTDWRQHRYGKRTGYGKRPANHYVPDSGDMPVDSLQALPFGDLIEYVCPDSNGQPAGGNDRYGYYADDSYEAMVRAAVVRLHTARGTLYIPATDSTDWDGAALHMRDAVLVDREDSAGNGCSYTAAENHTAAMREAGRAADRQASNWAEAERKYAEWDRQHQAAEEAIAEGLQAIREARDTVRQPAAELRTMATTLPPAICLTVRDRLQEARDTVRDSIRAVRDARHTLTTLGDAP